MKSGILSTTSIKGSIITSLTNSFFLYQQFCSYSLSTKEQCILSNLELSCYRHTWPQTNKKRKESRKNSCKRKSGNTSWTSEALHHPSWIKIFWDGNGEVDDHLPDEVDEWQLTDENTIWLVVENYKNMSNKEQWRMKSL